MYSKIWRPGTLSDAGRDPVPSGQGNLCPLAQSIVERPKFGKFYNGSLFCAFYFTACV